MEITIIPTGGLCNRMRAMATGIAIAQHYQSQANIYWNNCPGLKANFSDLFKPIKEKNIQIKENKDWLHNIGDTKNFLLRWPILRIKYNQIFFNYNTLKSHNANIFTQIDGKISDRTLFVSCYPMCELSNLHTLFIPTDEIQCDIDKITQHFSPQTIGIHIRRTDNSQSIKNSPIESFEQMMQTELKKDSNMTFYVASDDNEVKTYLKNKYPQNVITIFEDTSRNTTKGMHFAVVDLFCLSKTNHIIGSYYSSYSHIASILGGISVEYAKKIRA